MTSVIRCDALPTELSSLWSWDPVLHNCEDHFLLKSATQRVSQTTPFKFLNPHNHRIYNTILYSPFFITGTITNAHLSVLVLFTLPNKEKHTHIALGSKYTGKK